jgi:gliding motility-associated-like protein
MFKRLLLSLFVIIALNASGQSFYVTTNNGVKRITLSGASFTETQINGCVPIGFSGSIAFHNKALYYSNSYPLLSKATISGNTSSNCTVLGNFSVGVSLTIDKDGLVYTINGGGTSNRVYRFDPSNGVTTDLGAINYFPAGDLVFYEGDLYLASTVGIVKVNMSNPALSTLVIPTTNIIYGLTSVAYSSTKNVVYALSIANNGYTEVYALDLDHNQLGTKVTTLPYMVLDAASDVEDGQPPELEISSIKQSADCPFTGKGTLQVICTNPLVDYEYTLNGVTNNTGIFSGLNPGTYTITVKSPTETKSTVLNVLQFVPEKPTLEITPTNPVCVAPGQINFRDVDNKPGYKIKYGGDTFATDHAFINLAAGSYHFSVINENGCEVDAADVTLTQDLCRITVTNVLINEECNSPGKGNVQVLTAANNDVYTYSLNAVSNTTGVFNNLSAGAYQLDITSSNGDTKSLPVIVPDYNINRPIITLIKNDPSCDVFGTVSFTIQNGSAAQYKVRLGTDIFPLSHIFTALPAANYHFDILKQDNCLLTSKDVELARSRCTIVLDNTDVTEECNLPGKALVRINTKPHTVSYTYYLPDGTSNSTGIFNNVLPGSYTIKISSLEDEKTVDVIVPDYNSLKPVITSLTVNPQCEVSGSIKLMMPAGNNTGLYKVNYMGQIFAFDHVFDNLIAGSHHFEVLKQNDCLYKSVDVVLSRTKCDIVLSGVEVLQECDLIYRGSLQVKSEPHTYAYSYTLAGVTNKTGIFNNLGPGKYDITVTSAEDVKQLSAVVPDYKNTSPLVTYKAKRAICELKGDVVFSLSANSAGYKILFNGTTYPFDHGFDGLKDGEYDFTVLKPDGCLLNTYHVVIVLEICEVVSFTNTFTPNNDGINDTFGASKESKASNYRFRIYNRNGGLIFNSAELQNGWDGNYNGRPVPEGVYYWLATYLNNEGKSISQTGYVTLIR